MPSSTPFFTPYSELNPKKTPNNFSQLTTPFKLKSILLLFIILSILTSSSHQSEPQSDTDKARAPLDSPEINTQEGIDSIPVINSEILGEVILVKAKDGNPKGVFGGKSEIGESDFEFQFLVNKDSIDREKFLKIARKFGFEDSIFETPFEKNEKNKDLWSKISVTAGRNYVSCPICAKSFRQKSLFETHMLRMHMSEELELYFSGTEPQDPNWFSFLAEYIRGIKIADENPENHQIADRVCFTYLESVYKRAHFQNLYLKHTDTDVDFSIDRQVLMDKSFEIFQVCKEWRELPEIADLWNSLHSIWTKTLMVIGLLGTLLLFLFRIIEVFDRYDGDYYDVYGSDNKK